nr:bifunctional diaminohydroxyphosphoribosylaminopyrimidine deaminase/5-amino-6-(5-phosphoribosylamino)uracil reductase RibD [Ammoniphilus resinae]
MDLALQWASAIEGQTQPNPKVGAVIVKDGEIVGIGTHLKAGGPHAEVHALAMAGEKAKGATVYVTLEPCSHYGRTPPCAEALMKAGVAKVVIATLDPNPLVAGRGAAMLRDAGVEVVTGVCEQQSNLMNEVFNKFITTGMPFVTLKTAMTLDGKIATETGSSRWITGDEARQEVHQMRHTNQAILVGVETVRKDDPQLTIRLPQGGNNPIRIVLDSTLRTPLDAKVVRDGEAETWIYTTTTAAEETAKVQALEKRGVKVISLPVEDGERGIPIPQMLTHLGSQKISSLLVEGGARVNASFLKEMAVDKIVSYIAPKLVGGEHAPTPIGGFGVQEMDQAIRLTRMTYRQVGEDLRIEGYPEWRE